MKKINRPTTLIIVLAAVILLNSIVAVVAYMFRRSATLNNTLTPADVTCAVREVFDSNTKSSVKVENTGDIDAYIRLRVVAYWQDSKGNIVARTSPEIKFDDEWEYDTDQWIYDSEDYTFYHKAAIAPGALTPELFEKGFEGIKLTPQTETFDGTIYTYHPVIAFVAEAIQSEPDNAVTNSWGVTLTGGIISAAP